MAKTKKSQEHQPSIYILKLDHDIFLDTPSHKPFISKKGTTKNSTKVSKCPSKSQNVPQKKIPPGYFEASERRRLWPSSACWPFILDDSDDVSLMMSEIFFATYRNLTTELLTQQFFLIFGAKACITGGQCFLYRSLWCPFSFLKVLLRFEEMRNTKESF